MDAVTLDEQVERRFGLLCKLSGGGKARLVHFGDGGRVVGFDPPVAPGSGLVLPAPETRDDPPL